MFEHTAAYDAMISQYLREQIDAPLPDNVTLTFEKLQDLRYGENPHQNATYYKEIRPFRGSLATAKQLHGKELSFNNINDANGALMTLKEFTEPTVVASKHANPCGVGCGETLHEAYVRAHDCDPTSIFGGIVACNREVDKDTAEEMSKIFLEIVLAPSFSDEALEILTQKKNIRLMTIDGIEEPVPAGQYDMKKESGGLLIQDMDLSLYDEDALKVVTEKAPTDKEMADMKMAMKVVKHIKSNGIVYVKDGATVGIGPGQTNRIWAAQNAIRQAESSLEGAVMASDAFFPFSDCVEAAAAAGITAIIQPGGSIRDQESIDKANELGIAMVFSGQRHFKH